MAAGGELLGQGEHGGGFAGLAGGVDDEVAALLDELLKLGQAGEGRDGVVDVGLAGTGDVEPFAHGAVRGWAVALGTNLPLVCIDLVELLYVDFVDGELGPGVAVYAGHVDEFKEALGGDVGQVGAVEKGAVVGAAAAPVAGVGAVEEAVPLAGVGEHVLGDGEFGFGFDDDEAAGVHAFVDEAGDEEEGHGLDFFWAVLIGLF